MSNVAEDWRGEHFIRSLPRPVRGGECSVCGKTLDKDNVNGLCRKHMHASGRCLCLQCRRTA
jgi:hypothetical protein